MVQINYSAAQQAYSKPDLRQSPLRKIGTPTQKQTTAQFDIGTAPSNPGQTAQNMEKPVVRRKNFQVSLNEFRSSLGIDGNQRPPRGSLLNLNA